MRLGGASALVTGGASGLGAATAAALVEGGARVVILDLPGSTGEETAARIGATFVPADVTDEGQVRSAVEAAQALAPLRVAVNCAGIATGARTVGRDGPFPLELFERTIRVNVIGTFNVTRLAAAAMAANEPGVGQVPGGPETPERGVIVNTSSVAAFDGQIGQAAYSASKGAVAAMTLPIARDLAAQLIRVVAIAPGIMETPMLAGLPEDVRTSLGAQVPHPARLGSPAEFAALVRSAVENPYLNGEVIRFDAGIRMQPK
ncbi:SDR family NAD(P)-dependent oxidoreductase [Agromyces seonyuensis]|uniref:SDR family NAD(P)-dependent oxidoreductase n=1 Tax=Agromyces seonyuensis TaxID=2662446 RepID=A0A6I4NXW9_9MICO|nr:SDR family NAD(P)-dependent oxidoreductase [Agromyces seonyuensis]MWB99123.1 SDR family NAD(P)-dependent oxidoreductase [Agromyces seonyuensis]